MRWPEGDRSIIDINSLDGSARVIEPGFPTAVRIKRSTVGTNDNFTYYTSSDSGAPWAQNGPTINRTFAEAMLIGIGTVSHIQGTPCFPSYSNYVVVPYPVITTQPQNQTRSSGQTATFSVAGTTTPDGGALRYQWRFNGTPITDQTNASLSFTANSGNVGSYDVAVKNGGGTVYSSAATLGVATPPSITQQPASTTVNCPGPADFSVTATGDAPLAYQWFKNSAGINAGDKAAPH